VVFDDVVVLVEAKTTRLTASARLGTSTLAEDLNRTLGEAFQQIERSLSLIRDGHPAFAAVPQDRAFLGLVVTLEPYWNANSDEARSLVASPAPSVPTIVASSREVERWVADHLESGGGATLLRIANDPEVRTWNLELALPDRGNPGRPRNPLLEDAWRHLPWREAAEGRLGEQRS
jgi:hypothetical protein